MNSRFLELKIDLGRVGVRQKNFRTLKKIFSRNYPPGFISEKHRKSIEDGRVARQRDDAPTLGRALNKTFNQHIIIDNVLAMCEANNKETDRLRSYFI